jgi:VanZ family protein
MTDSKTKLYRWATVASPWLLSIYWIILYTLTHVPVPSGPPGSDKLLHIAAYFVLAFLFSMVLYTRSVPTKRLIITTIVSLCAFAIFDEVTQELVNRHCDPLDALADSVGIVLGITAFLWLARRVF